MPLAENFGALLPLLLGAPLLFTLLAGVSFIGTARGQRWGLTLAMVALVTGLCLIALMLFSHPGRGGAVCAIWILYFAPAVLAILSIGLWSERRDRR